jgi:adenine deaminase
MPHRHDESFLDKAIAAGAGEIAADLVIKNVQMFSVVDGSTVTTDIAIVGDRIVGTHDTYRAETPSMELASQRCPGSSTRISMSSLRL